MEAWASKGAPDHVWMEHIFPRMAALKSTFAGLTRCDADELAITTNISIAPQRSLPVSNSRASGVA